MPWFSLVHWSEFQAFFLTKSFENVVQGNYSTHMLGKQGKIDWLKNLIATKFSETLSRFCCEDTAGIFQKKFIVNFLCA